MSFILAFIRSVFFYIGYVLITLLLALWCLLAVWFLPEARRHVYNLVWCRAILGWFSFCCGVRVQIEGLENKPDIPVVFLANHQSEWETVFIFRDFSPVCPILKKELLNIPVYGWAMRLVKPIAIDRSKRHEAGKSVLTQGKDRLENGRSVIIFPEGTRSEPGQLKAFSRSGAKLAQSAGVPVVPIAHNAGLCWPARRFVKFPGTIRVQIGKPLDSQTIDPASLTEQAQEWVRQYVA